MIVMETLGLVVPKPRLESRRLFTELPANCSLNRLVPAVGTDTMKLLETGKPTPAVPGAVDAWLPAISTPLSRARRETVVLAELVVAVSAVVTTAAATMAGAGAAAAKYFSAPRPFPALIPC